ncbi:MAG: hypothetical protein ABSD08_09060 [Xanthobacteraceae bacterium]|jgi:hypothetical protein
MGMIRLIAAPIRGIARSRLFQLLFVVAIILLLENYSDNNAVFTQISDELDKLVDGSMQLFSQYFRMRTFTKSILTVGLMIAYVYLVCLLILLLMREAFRKMIDKIGRHNLFYLRNVIARERGIAAYRAWEPFERIRPASIPQEKWEEAFAWPANNKPPYPPLAQRMLWGAISYLIVVLAIAVLLQQFTPFPVLTWLGRLTGAWGS